MVLSPVIRDVFLAIVFTMHIQRAAGIIFDRQLETSFKNPHGMEKETTPVFWAGVSCLTLPASL
jgi:hypothetical protein